MWQSKENPRGRLWSAHRYGPLAVPAGRLMVEIRGESFPSEGPDETTVNRMWRWPAFRKKENKGTDNGPFRTWQDWTEMCIYVFLIRRKGKYQLESWGRAVEMNALVIFLILTLDLCLLQGSNKNEQIMLTSRDMCLFHLLICIIWDCLYYYYFFNFIGRTSLVALWLGLCASNAEVSSWILFWGTKILQVI